MYRSIYRALNLSAATGALVAAITFMSGCLGSDATTNEAAISDSEFSLGEETEAISTVEEEFGRDVAGGDGCRTASNCSNCVFYARCQNPGLPHGLFSYDDKKRIINTQDPEVGAIAIINTGNNVGHVAYVEAVNGSSITISEGNWPLGKCGQRSGTRASLKIVGFFK